MKARTVTPLDRGEDTSRHDWFLKDSTWNDSTWTFAPTNVLEEDYPVRIRWDFDLPSGRRFTDPRHAALLESAKQLVVIIRNRALISGLPQRATTVAGYFMALRKLLRWMDEEAFHRFSDLDSAALLRFQGDIIQRKNRTGAPCLPGPFKGSSTCWYTSIAFVTSSMMHCLSILVPARRPASWRGYVEAVLITGPIRRILSPYH